MIRFSKYIWLYACISSCVLIPGIIGLLFFGLRPAVDFTGGTLLELHFQSPTAQTQITQILAKDRIQAVGIQKSSSTNYFVRLKPETDETIALLEKTLSMELTNKVEIQSIETVGPVLGKELLQKNRYGRHCRHHRDIVVRGICI